MQGLLKLLQEFIGVGKDAAVAPCPPLGADGLWLNTDTGCLNPTIAARILAKDAQAPKAMSEAFVERRSIKANECIASVLPLLDQRSRTSVTTSQAIIIHKASRHSLALCLMTEDQVCQVGLAIQSKARAGADLTPEVIAFSKVKHPLVLACIWQCWR